MNLYALLGLIFVAGISLGIGVGFYLASNLFTANHKAEIDRLSNMLSHGRPDAPKAERFNTPPPVELRAMRMIERDTQSAAATRLQEMYKDRGLELSFDDALLQVKRLANGEAPIPA